MSIGFTFLTKDPELSRLRALVEYLREISDEFVFTIDDRTPQSTFDEIATWPGATVLGFKWNDDFSAARNYALGWMKSDWTAYFDPDEMPNSKLLRFMAEKSQATEGEPTGYLFDFHNFFGGTNFVIHQESDWHLRMWRTGHGRFYRKVHELVELDGRNEGATRGTNKVIKAPADAFVIHAKPAELIESSLEQYVKIESGQ